MLSVAYARKIGSMPACVGGNQVFHLINWPVDSVVTIICWYYLLRYCTWRTWNQMCAWTSRQKWCRPAIC